MSVQLYKNILIVWFFFVVLFSLDVYNGKEDAAMFAGKRPLISFLSWLDYCDQLIKEAQKVICSFCLPCEDVSLCRLTWQKQVYFFFVLPVGGLCDGQGGARTIFVGVMEPQLMQT